jgi:hypothetical protein
MGRKWCENGGEMVQNWRTSGAEMVKKGCRNGVENGAEIAPKWGGQS